VSTSSTSFESKTLKRPLSAEKQETETFEISKKTKYGFVSVSFTKRIASCTTRYRILSLNPEGLICLGPIKEWVGAY
jgi:hypothetical protein